MEIYRSKDRRWAVRLDDRGVPLDELEETVPGAGSGEPWEPSGR